MTAEGFQIGRRAHTSSEGHGTEWDRDDVVPMTVEPGSTDCRLLIDAKRSLEDVLKTLSDLPHTDHIRQQLLAVHNQLEGMHDLKRAGGAGVSFRSSSWCSKTTDVLAG